MTAGGNGHALPGHVRTAIDFVPLLVFFVANYLWGILPATGVLVVATVVATAILWLAERRIPPIPVATAVLVGFFGALTLVFDDAFFIKIKPTVVSLLFAAVLAGGLARGKLLVKYLFGAAGIQLRDAAWRVLTWRWIAFFVLLAALNEVVDRHLGELQGVRDPAAHLGVRRPPDAADPPRAEGRIHAGRIAGLTPGSDLPAWRAAGRQIGLPSRPTGA